MRRRSARASLHNPARDALGSPPFAPAFLDSLPPPWERCHLRLRAVVETAKGKEETCTKGRYNGARLYLSSKGCAVCKKATHENARSDLATHPDVSAVLLARAPDMPLVVPVMPPSVPSYRSRNLTRLCPNKQLVQQYFGGTAF